MSGRVRNFGQCLCWEKEGEGDLPLVQLPGPCPGSITDVGNSAGILSHGDVGITLDGTFHTAIHLGLLLLLLRTNSRVRGGSGEGYAGSKDFKAQVAPP